MTGNLGHSDYGVNEIQFFALSAVGALWTFRNGHLVESLSFPGSRDPAALTLSVAQGRSGSMQTVSLPYRCSAETAHFWATAVGSIRRPCELRMLMGTTRLANR
jgi:hypothetical protein